MRVDVSRVIFSLFAQRASDRGAALTISCFREVCHANNFSRRIFWEKFQQWPQTAPQQTVD